MKNLSWLSVALLLCMGAGAVFDSHAATSSATPSDGSVLPFPPVPSASKAAPRLQDSIHKRRAQPEHLKPGAPNVLIILIDDVGFGQAATFGGEVAHADAQPAARARASATTPSTPRRSARRRARRCSPAATTSASATAPSPSARWTGTATPA